MSQQLLSGTTPVGVGLRHVHYQDVLTAPADIDFVEVHAENFFASGGAALNILDQVAERYPVSLHGTAMGLGSVSGVPAQHMDALTALVERYSPVLVSEHAAFTWGHSDYSRHHAGDLLPIAFNEKTLGAMSENIIKLQSRLKRNILIENLSAYITPEGSTFSETDFLTALTARTGCKLLVDLNNLAVNTFNAGDKTPLKSITDWLQRIPKDAVGEIHLAGCTPVQAGDIMIDDHSQTVSALVWDAYRLALQRFGHTPTLVEWDTALPEWQVLLGEAAKARTIACDIRHSQEAIT